MKLNFKIVNLLMMIVVFGFSSAVLAQKTAPNNAQPKAQPKTANSKKAKNPATGEVATPKANNQRPPSTGTGNSNGRPESRGESLSELDRINRAKGILFKSQTFPANTVEDSGSNLARTRGFIKQAESHAEKLQNKYYQAKNINENNDNGSNYNYPYPSDMKGVKVNLQQALDYLNGVEFETGQNNRSKAIDFTERAIRQLDSYLLDPPASKPKRPTKQAPNGATPAKPRGTSQN